MNLNNGDNQRFHVIMHSGFEDSIQLPACTAARINMFDISVFLQDSVALYFFFLCVHVLKKSL